MNGEYLKGLQDVEDHIFHSTQRYGGAHTHEQLLHIMNDLNAFLHRNLYDAPQQP
jgi:hypothetical protein